jgi:hypothetical protein
VIAEEDRRKNESVLEPLQRAEELDVLFHLLCNDAAKIHLFHQNIYLA